MITKQQQEAARSKAAILIQKSGLAVRPDEIGTMETADFGLGELEQTGCQIVTLVNTERLVVKVLVLLPGQTLPEHRHPRLDDYEGKEETVRCQWGEVYVFTPGTVTGNPRGQPPAQRRHTYSAWQEHRLSPGEQVLLPPGTPHWFQGGTEGAVFWSFTTRAVDLADIFSDPQVSRQTIVVDASPTGNPNDPANGRQSSGERCAIVLQM
jgi:D-lyxose ketol-isomerase